MEQRDPRPVSPLGYVYFTLVIFIPIKRLKPIESWFSQSRALDFFIHCCQERVMRYCVLLVCRHYNILHCLLGQSRVWT